MVCAVECFTWPAPDLDCLPCLPPGMQPERFCRLLEEANETVFGVSGRCYTGCDCWAELQICPTSCECVAYCNCDPCFVEKVDLSHFLGSSVWEVLEVKVEGEPVETVEDFRLLENCFLVCPPEGWPQQYLRNGFDGECTWTVKVRYGTKVPKRLLRLRDKYFFSLLKECYPSSLLSCDTADGLTKITTKSGTYEFGDQMSVLDEVACYFGPSPAGLAGFYDPGNPDLMYKVLVVDKGSEAEEFDCEAWVLDWFGGDEEQITPAPVEGQKLYNKLGQPVA